MRRASVGANGRRETSPKAGAAAAAHAAIPPQSASTITRDATTASSGATHSPSVSSNNGTPRAGTPNALRSARTPNRSRSPVVGGGASSPAAASRKSLAAPSPATTTTITTSTATNKATVGTTGYTRGSVGPVPGTPRATRTTPRRPSSPTLGHGRGRGGAQVLPSVSPASTAASPPPPAQNNRRRGARTLSPASAKDPDTRKNSRDADAAAASSDAASILGDKGSPAPSTRAAPTHLQQLQAPPKKTAHENRGLKTGRDIRRETTSAGSNGGTGGSTSHTNASHAGVGGLLSGAAAAALVSSASSPRAMAPIVHIRVRPLLSYLNESSEKRKVWYLDHENLVVRAPTGTNSSPNGSYGTSVSQGGGGSSMSTARVNDRRPTLPPSKAKVSSHGHAPIISAAAALHPQHSGAQQPQPIQPLLDTRSHSSPSVESFVVLGQGDKHGIKGGSPAPVPLGEPSGGMPVGDGVVGLLSHHAHTHSRSVSEQSLVSDQLGSERLSGGHLSSSSPPALQLMQPSVSSSMSGTSTPLPLPKLGNFFSGSTSRGSRSAGGNGLGAANEGANSVRTSPAQEGLGTSGGAGQVLSPTKSASHAATPSPPQRRFSGMSAGTAAKGRRRDSRAKEGRPGTPGASMVVGSGGGAMDGAEWGVGNEQHFNFEFIHDESATQEEVFEDSVLRFADEALLAQNVTILCYGPTGSGKTFSMMGNTSSSSLGTGHGAGTAGTGVSRRASMVTGVFNGRSNSYVATTTGAPVKAGTSNRAINQSQTLSSANAVLPEAVEAANAANRAAASEALEDSIAQVSEEDTDDDEWPLFDHTWYRDRQRRAMLLESGHAGGDGNGRGGGGTGADNMRTTEMGILPRLVRVLLDRRHETTTLNTVESYGTSGSTTATASSGKRAGAPSASTAGQSTPSPAQAKKRAAKGVGQPTRRTISLTLQDLTFYGIEIYCDELSDLMDPGKRPIANVSDTGGLAATCSRLDQAREDAVRTAVANASSGNRANAAARANTGGGLPIESLEDLRRAYRLARRNRVTAPHARNERSSRSHAVFVLQLRFELQEQVTDVTTGEVLHETAQPLDSFVAMVDLAGSERLKESQVESGQALREAQYINKSLSALSSVVLALYQRSSHIPYRDSKLTRMLRPCLEGGRVLILVHVAPCSGVNTLNTLKFADQVRHTMVQTHSFAGDANKRGLLDIFADLVDPEQAKIEAAYTHAQERYDQICAEVRLAHLTCGGLFDRGGSVGSVGGGAYGGFDARASVSCSAALDNSTTLTMSRVSSSHGSFGAEGEETGEADCIAGPARQSSFSPSAPREDSTSFTALTTLPADAPASAVRAYKLRTLVARHFAPLKASEDAGVQEAIRDIALERDRRVEAAKRKIETEILNMRAAINEMDRFNAQLARENASPLPADPYCQELSRQVRTTTEEVREHQAHNAALQSCVNVLRQRVSAQEDIDAGVNADIEEMRSKGLLPLAPATPPPAPPRLDANVPNVSTLADPANETSYLSYATSNSQSLTPISSPPPASAGGGAAAAAASVTSAWIATAAAAAAPTPPPASVANSLTYMDSEVVTDAEMREIGYQQVLLSQELSALRMETACYALGDGIWEGLWARALRQEMLTALRVEVALMEKVLLDPEALQSLVQSAKKVVVPAVMAPIKSALPANAEGRRSHRVSPIEDYITTASTPVSPAPGTPSRRKPSPGKNRKGPPGKSRTTNMSSNHHNNINNNSASDHARSGVTTPPPTLQQVAEEALTQVEAYLTERQQRTTAKGGDAGDASHGGEGEQRGVTDEGRRGYHASATMRSLSSGDRSEEDDELEALYNALGGVRASGEQANRDTDATPSGKRRVRPPTSGAVAASTSTMGTLSAMASSITVPSGATAAAATAAAANAVVEVPNPLEAAFYHEPARVRTTESVAPAGAAPASLSGSVGTANTATAAQSTTTTQHLGAPSAMAASVNAASRRGSLADTIAAAYAPLTLVGSYHDEEQLQRMAVLKMLLEGVVCEAVCVGDEFPAVSEAFLQRRGNESVSRGGRPADDAAERHEPHSEEDAAARGADHGGGEHANHEGEKFPTDHLHGGPAHLPPPLGLPSPGSRRGSGSSTAPMNARSGGHPSRHRSGSAQLPLTRHYGRLRLVRKGVRGGAGSTNTSAGNAARRNPLVPDIPLGAMSSAPPGHWIPASEGAVYCLEFVYSHHGVPLPPRVADAVTAAVTPSARTQLEEMVDSLPSPMDVRRGYTPAPGHHRVLSATAAALLKERRLFSIPLNEPQLAVDLHLVEADPTGSGGGGGNAVADAPPTHGASLDPSANPVAAGTQAHSIPTPSTRTTPPIEPSHPSPATPEASLPVMPRQPSQRHFTRRGGGDDDDNGNMQIALELRGIPLSHNNPFQPQSQQHQPQQTPGQGPASSRAHMGPQNAHVDDLGASTGGLSLASTTPAAPVMGKDVVMAKRMREGGELLLPSPCILANKGTCTLLLRFPRQATSNATRLESVEAVVASLCAVMAPAILPSSSPAAAATGTPGTTPTVSPTKKASSGGGGARHSSRLRSPQVDEALLPSSVEPPRPDTHLSDSDGVVCVYAHIPRVLLSPNPASSPTTEHAAHKEADVDPLSGSVNKKGGGRAQHERDGSPEPRPPAAVPRKKSGPLNARAVKGGGKAAAAASASASKSVSKTGHTASASSAVSGPRSDRTSLAAGGDPSAVRGASLRVHFHFPGTLSDNAVDLGALAVGEVQPWVQQAIVRAAEMVQGFRVLTLGPFTTPLDEANRGGRWRHPRVDGEVSRYALSSGSSTPSSIPLASSAATGLRYGEDIRSSVAPSTPPPRAATTTMPGDRGRRQSDDETRWQVAQRLLQLTAFSRNICSLIRHQIFEAEDMKADVAAVNGTGEGGRAVSSGRLVREVAAEAREAMALLAGGGNRATGQEGTFTGTHGAFPHSDTSNLAALRSSVGNAIAGDAAGTGAGSVKGVVTLAQARELGGATLPWTVWQWAYRWPAVAALSAQLERAALATTSTLAHTAPAGAGLGLTFRAGRSALGGGGGSATGSPGTAVPLTVTGAPQVQQSLLSVLAPLASPRGAASLTTSGGAGGSGMALGLPLPLPPTTSLSTSPLPASPLGLVVASTGGSGVGDSTDPASPWSVPQEGSPLLEPMVLASESDEDDMFNSFGHGNWMVESAALAVGDATHKTVWLPELALLPVPEFLAALAAQPAAAGDKEAL